jgi:hypothetical protein
MPKEVNMNILDHQEEKEMTKLLHIKIHIKKTNIDTLFDFGSQAYLVAENMVGNL